MAPQLLKLAIGILLLLALLSSSSASGMRALHESAASEVKKFHFKPFRPFPGSDPDAFSASKRFEGSSEYVKMRYHMGPVLSQQMHIYIVWYGLWKAPEKSIIRDFLSSVSPPKSLTKAPESAPSVESWWSTVRLYTDQTMQNITNQVLISGEHDVGYTHGHSLTRLTMQEVLKSALAENNGTLPVNSRKGIYLIFTSGDVVVQDFCRAVCGFHYFSFPSIVGYTLPYAWVGHSEKQCPEVCAYPFVVPSYMTHTKPMKAPNGNPAVDGMVSVIAHELAEISSNPLINAWYAGEDPTSPTEIADLCEGMYGSGAGGGYAGEVLTDEKSGVNYNMRGVNGRKFLVQWVWNPILSACSGPNAKD